MFHTMKARIITAISAVTVTMVGLIGMTFYYQRLRQAGPLTGTQLFWGDVVLLTAAMVAVVVLAFWIFTAPKHVVTSLHDVNAVAREIADELLPTIVARLAEGQAVDVDKLLPRRRFGPDEFGDLGRAVLHLGREGAVSAIESAQNRGRGTQMAALARRVQGILQDQLKSLEALERKYGDSPDILETFYEIDAAVTRLRRYVENLLILAGVPVSRSWTTPQSVFELTRGATSAVLDYKRIENTISGTNREVSIPGRMAADVMHLVAGLSENALQFSPPGLAVTIDGKLVDDGFLLEIMDRGLGLDDATRAGLNARLQNPVDLVAVGETKPQLGLHVVGKLARRHGISVQLQISPYGGTTAAVLLPNKLLVSKNTSADRSPASASPSVVSAAGASPLPDTTERGAPPIGTQAPGWQEPTT